jgi:hypothetical protein
MQRSEEGPDVVESCKMTQNITEAFETDGWPSI